MTIYYSTMIPNRPEGGIKQIFRHVEVLRSAGWDARVLALGTPERVTWTHFPGPIDRVRRSLPERCGDVQGRIHPRLRRWGRDPLQALYRPGGPRIVTEQGMRTLGRADVLVLPEHFGMELKRLAGDHRVVFFNQNVHYMFRGLQPGEFIEGTMCGDPSIPSLVVSRHNRDYLEFAVPGRKVFLTTNGVDTAKFCFQAQKRRQIAFMPRKLPNDVADVLAILKNRGVLSGWELRPIHGMSEDEVARHLRESMVFLSTSHVEGFGLPPLEALLCGCQVVGYAGAAAAEFLDERTGFPVPDMDRLGLARRLEWLLLTLNSDPRPLLDRAAKVAAELGQRYSLQQERQAILEAWRQLAPEHVPQAA